MNTDLILTLNQRIEEVESIVIGIEKVVNALKINDQQRLIANPPIPPAIACKVAYDKNGLVIRGTNLDQSDIPELGIDKVLNLRSSLEDKASKKELQSFKNEVTNIIQPTMNKLNQIVGTGTKVNFTADGRIVSVADLLPSDIPILPMAKIDGLEAIISSFNSLMVTSHKEDEVPTIKVSAGTYIKVTVDQYGRVINGEHKLGLNDIPSELISRINTLESRFVNIPSQQTIDAIQQELVNKLDANEPIVPGTYTKVRVDSKGLVKVGDKLTIRDLPELNISDIVGLDKAIRDKADQNDLLEIRDTVTSLVSSLSSIGEINGIKNELINKASDSELKTLTSKVNRMQGTMDNLINKIPSDMITTQLAQIINEVSILSGRIASLEHHLGITNPNASL